MTEPQCNLRHRASTVKENYNDIGTQERVLKAERIIDREERAVAALLTRFKNLVSLAAQPVDDGATKEVAAAQAFQMEVESSALVRQLWSGF
jgi:predicted metal-dependent hydrolase